MSELSNIKPIDLFWTFHQVKNIFNLNNLISTKKNHYGEYTIFTFSVKSKGRPDDTIYAKYPDLVLYLPRACSILCDSDGNIISYLTGFRKFTGDEDDVETHLFDRSTINSWIQDDKCEIIQTKKANGEFAIMKLLTIDQRLACFFGSKNCHYFCFIDEMEIFLESKNVTDLAKSIGQDILKNIDKLINLIEEFKYLSLVGEYVKDGSHFTTGDNDVTWFGLSNKGVPVETFSTLEKLQSFHIKTIQYQQVFSPSDPIEKLDVIDQSCDCDPEEGSVLYYKNTETGEYQLAKKKGARYKVWRMFREKFTSDPVNIDDKFPKRVIDTKNYHKLNTDACIKISIQLFQFAKWLADNNLPCCVIGHQKIESVKEYGFYFYWRKFIQETKIEEVTFTPADFGEFNPHIYKRSIKLFDSSNKEPPLVVFMQGISGIGKSTIYKLISDRINVDQVEQDVYHGDTKMTQFRLKQLINQNNGNPIIISRNNANNKHYDNYLKIAMENNTKIIFISNNDIDSSLCLAISLAGILERSESKEQVVIGKKLVNFNEVVKFTTDCWKSFRYHPQSIKISTFKKSKIEDDTDEAVKRNKMKEYVLKNELTLTKLRRPLKDIVQDYCNIITNPPYDSFIKKQIHSVMYVGLTISDCTELDKIINSHQKLKDDDEIYNHHTTQAFLGKGKSKQNVKIVPDNTKCKLFIDALVINKETNASAFRVKHGIMESGESIEFQNDFPHITAVVPLGEKPSGSNLFVGKMDESVKIVSMDLEIDTICYWYL